MNQDTDLDESNPEDQDENSDYSWLKPWQYKKGQSGNPGGRPVGSVSLKTYVKNKLLSMTDEQREEFLEGLDKKTIWEMAEDKPANALKGHDGGAVIIQFDSALTRTPKGDRKKRE
jgi:hypothetical protein